MTSRDQMQQHLALLFEGCDPSKFIDLRPVRPDSTNAPEKFFWVDNQEDAIEYALEVANTHHVYVAVLPRDHQSGKAEAVSQADVIWVDCDGPESVEKLKAFALQPSLTVGSGSEGNMHAYWKLTKPVDPGVAEALNDRLVAHLGADKSCRDRARVMRLAGSLNHKHDPPKPAEIVAFPDTRYDIEEIEAVVDPLPEEPPSGSRCSARKPIDSPSPVVQGALSKLEKVKKEGAQWKALCPAHDDHDPSLSIAQGDDGRCLLHCFAGCEYEEIVAAMGVTPADLMPTSGKQSAASRLVNLAIDSLKEYFHSPDGTTWVMVEHGGHLENWPIMSVDAERWLRQIYFEASGKGLNQDAVNGAKSTLDALARFDGSEHEVPIRVAGDPSAEVLVDVGDAARTVVRIDSDGFGTVDVPPVRFYRSPSSTEMAIPDPGGSVDELWWFVNARDQQTRMRLVGFLLMCLHPSGPYPVLNIHGEQGSAKSTLSRLVLDLVDPHKAGLLSGTPKPHDLAITASTNRLIVLDNVSSIKQGLSDALCRISTGGGLRTRRLYTDTDEVVLEFCRPVVVNGIGQVIHRPDLLERTAPIELKAIAPEERLTEDEIWAKWREARPLILGGLLNAVSTAIQNVNEIELSGLPRLADWARWGEAAGPALGWEPGAFVAAIDAGQDEQVELSIDDVIEIRGLIEFMADQPEVRLSATDLLDKIHEFLEIDPVGRQDLLRRGADLSRELKVFAPALRKHGIECQFGREGGGTRDRYILVRKVS